MNNRLNQFLYKHYRTPEEVLHAEEIQERTLKALSSDTQAVQNPRLTPFTSLPDVLDRLLPYHLFQYPDVSPKDLPSTTAPKINIPTDEEIRKRIEAISKKFEHVVDVEAQKKSCSVWRGFSERLCFGNGTYQ